MKTTITIQVVKPDDVSTIECNDAIESAFGEFHRIVTQYTRFNENSELSNLNRRANEWTAVSPEFFQLITIMLDLARASDGAFDPTVIDFLEAYGYDPNYDFSKLDSPDLDSYITKLARERARWQDIDLDPENLKVKLQPKQRLELGGIGKGYAIDCAFTKLEHLGNFLIDAGGDLRVLGHNEDGQPWRIALKHKSATATEANDFSYVELTSGALACSGSWARKVKQFHHLINPETGKPHEQMQTIYVQAADATTADGWATALFVGGQPLLAKQTAGIEALLIDTADKAAITPGLQAMLTPSSDAA